MQPGTRSASTNQPGTNDPSPSTSNGSNPVPQQDTKVARFLRRGLVISAALLGVFILLGIFDALSVFGGMTLPITFLTLFGSTLLFGLARFTYAIFAQLQSRLSEWIVTFMLVGVAAPLCAKLFAYYEWNFDEKSAASWGTLMGLLIVLSVLGSSWGWRMAKRRGEENASARVVLMAAGWLLIFGLLFMTVWLVLTIGLVISLIRLGTTSIDQEFLRIWARMLALSLPALPALCMEWRMRKRKVRAA